MGSEQTLDQITRVYIKTLQVSFGNIVHFTALWTHVHNVVDWNVHNVVEFSVL